MAITRIGNPAIADIREPNFRNIIINGDMSLAQRGTSTASITGGGYYSCDRWRFDINSQGTWTQSQSTDVPTGQGFAKSTKLDCTTADASPAAGDLLAFVQKVEGQNLQYLKKGTSSAESTTLSFWVKSNKTGTYIAELVDSDNSRQISKSYTISSANTWEKKTLTYAGDTSGAFGNDNGASLELHFWLGAGSNYTSGTLSTTWTSITTANRAVGQVNLADSTSNEWYVTGVQLEAGTTASEFEFLPVDVNLRRCQRYYMRWQGDTSDQRSIANGLCCGTGQVRMIIVYPTTLRTNPTVTEVGLETLNAVKVATAVSLDATVDPGINGVNAQINADSGTPYTVGQAVSLRTSTSASAFLAVDAEL